ncbi:MAG: helix-turn-helix transcriptional regulator [Candidatus Heimdallarchaeota archaeon]|nr:helix-turn-helix transcriptional regulator [Candidatus Heimdallarchaeota archaeon]
MTDLDRDILFSFWDTIPDKRNFPSDVIVNIVGNEMRKFIMNQLRYGVKEQGYKIRRRALSAKELYDQYIISHPQSSITIQNVHFHLKKLLKHDLIYVVATRIECNNKTRYYGRTSKISSYDDADGVIDPSMKVLLEKLAKFSATNKDVQESNQKLFNSLYSIQADLFEQIVNPWVSKHFDALIEEGIDLFELSEFLALLMTSHNRLQTISQEILATLGLMIE